MMSYENWLNCILAAATHIASRAHQEETWKAGGNLVSSPDEAFLGLMEDCTSELFFETYGKTLSQEQVQRWNDLKTRLESYYDRVPLYPEPMQVLNDPEWDLVRQAAGKFVQSFNRHGIQPSE
jgi:hypothetical protein